MTTQILIFIALKLAEIAALLGACWVLTKVGRWVERKMDGKVQVCPPLPCAVACLLGLMTAIVACSLLLRMGSAIAANWQWAGRLAG